MGAFLVVATFLFVVKTFDKMMKVREAGNKGDGRLAVLYALASMVHLVLAVWGVVLCIDWFST